MPTPVYLPPGHDPTQVERPTERPGCLKFFVIAAFLIGGCMGAAGVSFATSAAASAAHPAIKATPTIEATHAVGTPTPTPRPVTINPVKERATPVVTGTPTAVPTMQTCWHRVQPGDTLLGITARYGASAWGIIRANGIRDSNRIYAGSVLHWPCKLQIVPTPTVVPTAKITSTRSETF